MKEWLGNIKLTDISIIIVMLAGITTFIKNLLDIIDRLKKKKTKNRKPKKRQKKKRK
ncbi:hypothetical protein [Niallia circulans]|uniref:hypothetical protein n=1 Tax=Niallia circulans TaxID=1397 RepID=UPI0013DE4C06|nr:hypothetical protein [Niallia circulans]